MSDSSEKRVKKLNSDQEDPVIEIPQLAGNELMKKSQLTRMDFREIVVRCTSCFHQINHHDFNKLKKHNRLGVIICSDCYDFYGTSEFSQDESGYYNYCTWCGNGGKLYLCDFCPNTFCSTCVRQNVGLDAVSKMSEEGWICYVCDSSKLKYKVAFCDLILEYSKNLQFKENKKASAELNKKCVKNWLESHNWLLSAFDSINDTCKSFHRRVEKLKNIGMSQSKSLKHIISKFEEIVISHKDELNHITKSVSRQYILYLEEQIKVNKNHEESSESKDSVTENIEKNPELDKNGNDSWKKQKGDVEIENVGSHKIDVEKNDSDSGTAELCFNKSNEIKKVSVSRKLKFNSSSSTFAWDSDGSIYFSSDRDLKTKAKKKEKRENVEKSRTKVVVVTKDDPKLKLETNVILRRCDHLLPNGETTIPLPASYVLEYLDKEIKSLIKGPVIREKQNSSDTEIKKKLKALKKTKVSKKKYCSSLSSIRLSSSEDEEVTKKKLFKSRNDDLNTLAKKKLLSMASDESSFNDTTEEEEEPKKEIFKKGTAQSGSSDDFQPKKKKKFDVLHKGILSEDDSDFEGEKEPGDRKNQTKRTTLASNYSISENKKPNLNETSSTDSEEIQRKKRKKLKKVASSSSSDGENQKERKRIKKIPASSNSDGENKKKKRKRIKKMAASSPCDFIKYLAHQKKMPFILT